MKKIYVIILLVILLVLSTKFYSTNDVVQYDDEIVASITQRWDAPAEATVNYIRTKAIEELDGNSIVELKYGDRTLIYGTVEGDNFSKDRVDMSIKGKLFEYGHKYRSFYQSTTGITAAEAFTNAFNDGSTFSYFSSNNKYYVSSYSTPFIDDVDAETYVVPCDESNTWDEFFDLQGNTGLRFMDILANSAYLGSNYRYHYWYERINDTNYLFFQPEGWGKTWKNLESVEITSRLHRSFENLYNDVIVRGGARKATIPTDQDKWTESDASVYGWVYTNGAVDTVLSTSTTNQVGYNSLYYNASVPNGSVRELYRDFIVDDTGLDFTTFTKFHLWYKLNHAGAQGPALSSSLRIEDSDGDYVGKSLNDDNAWHELEITEKSAGGGASEWDADTGLNWADVVRVAIDTYNFAIPAGQGDVELYFDNLYIQIDSAKSENAANSSGYDSDSADEYGRRTVAINANWTRTVSDCNAFASNLVNYYKDPEYNLSIKVPYFLDVHVNDVIEGTFYGFDLTLPVNSITWNFRANGDIETNLQLGAKRYSPEKLLKRMFNDVETLYYDAGIKYYIY